LAFLLSCKDSTQHEVSRLDKKEQWVSSKDVHSIREAIAKVKDGDLVVRCGRDFTSQSLSKLNRRNSTYSHCGLIRIEKNLPYVYHAMGGEFNPTQALVRESLVDFIHPKHESRFAFFRLDSMQVDWKKIFRQVEHDYQNKLPFDMDFDLNTKDRMYCSEWVAHCLQKGLTHSASFNISQIGMKSFLGVDDIFLHPAFTQIMSHNFE
jgi:hypothetical protein